MKATVGRVVHFYDHSLNINGQGAGPYAAMVTQLFPGSDYINLTVFAPFEVIQAGSVAHEDSPHGAQGRYWAWPPRE
jgi:hypothetical protein